MLFAHITILCIAFAALIWTANMLVSASTRLAHIFQVSPLIIGVFIVGFGTSLPELLVSVISSAEGDLPMAVGNALGSNTTNVALVIGACLVLRRFAVRPAAVGPQMPPVIAACALPGLLLLDLELTRVDGVLLLVAMGACLYWMFRCGDLAGEEGGDAPAYTTRKAFVMAALSLVGLLVSADFAVWSAVEIATTFGVGTDVIGLTILAVGTSLPELGAALVATLNRRAMLAVGNILGSLVFNSLAINGVAALVHPDVLPATMLVRDASLMLALTLTLTVFLLFLPRFNLVKGVFLLAVFCAYDAMLYLL